MSDSSDTLHAELGAPSSPRPNPQLRLYMGRRLEAETSPAAAPVSLSLHPADEAIPGSDFP